MESSVDFQIFEHWVSDRQNPKRDQYLDLLKYSKELKKELEIVSSCSLSKTTPAALFLSYGIPEDIGKFVLLLNSHAGMFSEEGSDVNYFLDWFIKHFNDQLNIKTIVFQDLLNIIVNFDNEISWLSTNNRDLFYCFVDKLECLDYSILEPDYIQEINSWMSNLKARDLNNPVYEAVLCLSSIINNENWAYSCLKALLKSDNYNQFEIANRLGKKLIKGMKLPRESMLNKLVKDTTLQVDAIKRKAYGTLTDQELSVLFNDLTRKVD